MSKFKVGDLVRVKKPANINEGPAWEAEMDVLNGRVVEIDNAAPHLHQGMDCFASGEWLFADDWADVVFSPSSASGDPTTLTRRDRFAMAALTGLCANCDSAGMFSWTPEGVVDYANQIADLMEAARNKEGGE